MVTLSSILSWRIPWREAAGWLQSIGSAKGRAPLKQGSSQAHKEKCVCLCVRIIKIPGGEHSNPLQYSFLENPMERGVRWARIHSVCKESSTTEAR